MMAALVIAGCGSDQTPDQSSGSDDTATQSSDEGPGRPAPAVASPDELFSIAGEIAGCTGSFVSDDGPAGANEMGGCPAEDPEFIVFEVYASGEDREATLSQAGLSCSTVVEVEDAVDELGGVSVIGANWQISEISIENAQAMQAEFGVEFQVCDL